MSDADRRVERLEKLVAVLLEHDARRHPSDNFDRIARFLKEFHHLPLSQGGIDSRDVEQLAKMVDSSERLRALIAQLEKIVAHQRETEQATYAFLVAQSLGLDTATVPLHRFIPVRVFLAKGEVTEAARTFSAVRDTLEAAGFVATDVQRVERGSWYHTFFAKSKTALTHREVLDRLEKTERALELAALGRPQAEADEKHARGVAEIIKSLDHTPTAAIQIGSILLVKTTDPQTGPTTIVRTLTQKEMIAIERNELLMRGPDELLKTLDGLRALESGTESVGNSVS